MIGVFDSGLGGLSVLRHIVADMPQADIRYVADRARAPYGRHELSTVRRWAEQISDHLVERGATVVVLACNAASAAALHHLRHRRPDIAFVGMEPAVKPAASVTTTGVIGVLTTAATFQGDLYASVVNRHAFGLRVETAVCDGWVDLVETGHVEGPEVEAAVRGHVGPLLAAGADTLVLGCTHYPFLRSAIERVAGPDVRLIDPAPAVAAQVARLARPRGLAVGSGTLVFEATGDIEGLDLLTQRLSGLAVSTQVVTFPPHDQ